jgi:hypothetical protein
MLRTSGASRMVAVAEKQAVTVGKHRSLDALRARPRDPYPT